LQKKKNANRKAVIIHHNNVVDYKNENAVVGVGRLNFPVVNKSVPAKVREVEIELAASL